MRDIVDYMVHYTVHHMVQHMVHHIVHHIVHYKVYSLSTCRTKSFTDARPTTDSSLDSTACTLSPSWSVARLSARKSSWRYMVHPWCVA